MTLGLCGAYYYSTGGLSQGETLKLHPEPYSPPQVDRIWGVWGSHYNIPKARLDLLKEDYNNPGRLGERPASYGCYHGATVPAARHLLGVEGSCSGDIVSRHYDEAIMSPMYDEVIRPMHKLLAKSPGPSGG